MIGQVNSLEELVDRHIVIELNFVDLSDVEPTLENFVVPHPVGEYVEFEQEPILSDELLGSDLVVHDDDFLDDVVNEDEHFGVFFFLIVVNVLVLA